MVLLRGVRDGVERELVLPALAHATHGLRDEAAHEGDAGDDERGGGVVRVGRDVGLVLHFGVLSGCRVLLIIERVILANLRENL